MELVSFSAELTHLFFYQLTTLVRMQTCFWLDNNIKEAITYCYHAVGDLPDNWKKEIDTHGNLLIYNRKYNLNKPLIYLSSHIDVVGVNENEWLFPPFEGVNTEDYIIGRGVNDCKAGTAFQLALIQMLNLFGGTEEYNIGFMIMFREEGNRGKTSSFIDFNCIPTSLDTTYFMTMENTVSIINEFDVEIGIYNKEPHNLFIRIDDELPAISKYIAELFQLGWHPIAVKPQTEGIKGLKKAETVHNLTSGHSAMQVNRNLIHILETMPLDDVAIEVGTINDVSVVPKEINLYKTNCNLQHALILNYRGFETIQNIKLFLNAFSYTELFDFELGLGSEQSNFFNSSVLAANVSREFSGTPNVFITPNPGRSDASAIYNNLSEIQRKQIIPFACGPGCRSHVDRFNIRHATHGENEGFYKPSAEKSLPFFLNLIEQFKIN